MQEKGGHFLGQIKKALSFSNINKNIDKQEAKKLKRRSSLMTLDHVVNNQRILEEENARFDEVSYASLMITNWSSVARAAPVYNSLFISLFQWRTQLWLTQEYKRTVRTQKSVSTSDIFSSLANLGSSHQLGFGQDNDTTIPPSQLFQESLVGGECAQFSMSWQDSQAMPLRESQRWVRIFFI